MGIEGFRLHDCRHTFATRLVAKGFDLITVKELCGHSSVKITERYTHSNQDRKRKAVESLAEKELKKTENREDLLLNCDVGKSRVDREALNYLFSSRWN